MKGMDNHLYIVYHKIDDDGCVLALPCVGDQDLMIHGKLVDDMGIKITRVLDMEYDLGRFMNRIIYEGLLYHWGDDHSE